MPLVKCPKCEKQVEWSGNDFRPFCSERCQMLDFGGWIDGEYGVPEEDMPSDLEGLTDEQLAVLVERMNEE